MEKKYWRCFVCNDIHYGIAPPELCPTYKVLNAYVEISSEEARKILGGGVDTVFNPEDFRAALERFTAGNVFTVNPDNEKVEMLLQGIFNNEKNHGMKYCPCRLCSKNWEGSGQITSITSATVWSNSRTEK